VDSQVEGTEGHSDAEADRSHVLPELASRDSDVEASSLSSLSDENVLERAAVGASSFTESAMPSHSMQDVVIATTQLQQQPITTHRRLSSPAASHAAAGSSCPSLESNQLVLPAQSDPGYSTLYPAYIDVTAVNAMRTIASVVATTTADSVIDRQSTSQSDPGQTSTQTVVYDTVAMGTGSLHATPPGQLVTPAYTQLRPMDPGHSRQSIDKQLGPRHSGHFIQSIHRQLGPAPIEPEYTSQPGIDSQPSLSMNVDDVMHTRVPYRDTRSVDIEVPHSVPLSTYVLDVYGRQPMSPIVYTSGIQADTDASIRGPYTHSASRDVDPSRPAHTHTHCRQEELEEDARQSTILAQGHTGDSLGPRTHTIAIADAHSLASSQAGSQNTLTTGRIALMQSGSGLVPATDTSRLSRNQVILAPIGMAQSESALANTGRDGQAARDYGTTQVEASLERGHKRKPPGVTPSDIARGLECRSVVDGDEEPIQDTRSAGLPSIKLEPRLELPVTCASARYVYPRTVPGKSLYAARAAPLLRTADAEYVVGASAQGLPPSALPSATATARQLDTEPQDFEMPALPGLRHSSTVYADVHQPHTPAPPTLSAYVLRHVTPWTPAATCVASHIFCSPPTALRCRPGYKDINNSCCHPAGRLITALFGAPVAADR